MNERERSVDRAARPPEPVTEALRTAREAIALALKVVDRDDTDAQAIYINAVAQIDAALSAQPTAGWRELEDGAPKDGTWLLGYNPNSGMAWAPYEFVAWGSDYTGREYWQQEDTSEESECTHWMLRPTPPDDDWKEVWKGGPYER